jgi:hypothetical protein
MAKVVPNTDGDVNVMISVLFENSGSDLRLFAV